MRTILLALLATSAISLSSPSPAHSQERAVSGSDQPAPPTSTSRYSATRSRSQQDCPTSWCAPGFELTLLDDQSRTILPGRMSGYTHLRVDSSVSSVVMKNDRPHRVMVLFSVNHKNPLDGGRAVQSSPGYVIPARSELVVEKTSLPGEAWFSSHWPQSGHMQINLHNETASRPIDGGPPPHAPAQAREYITDDRGKRFWVPPHDFVFRHDSKDLSPSATIYMTYNVLPRPTSQAKVEQQAAPGLSASGSANTPSPSSTP